MPTDPSMNTTPPTRNDTDRKKSWWLFLYRTVIKVFKATLRSNASQLEVPVQLESPSLNISVEQEIAEHVWLLDFDSQNPNSMNRYVNQLLNIPGFPESPEEADDLLSIIHSWRGEQNLYKLGAEHALHQMNVFARALQRRSHTMDEGERLLTLCQLDRAKRELLKADAELGAARGFLCSKSLPIKSSATQDHNLPRDESDEIAESMISEEGAGTDSDSLSE